MTDVADFEHMTCPTPRNEYERVLLGHGSGGKLSADLIQRVFTRALATMCRWGRYDIQLWSAWIAHFVVTFLR